MTIPIFAAAMALGAKCGAGADTLGGTPAVASGGASAPRSSTSGTPDPKKFCAALLPKLQELVKVPLTLSSADDATSDQMHAGEAGFLSCVNSSGAYRVTVTMSDEKSFTSAPKTGYEPLAGYGDIARSVQSAFNWVDVMKGKRFCEAIVGVSDKDLVGTNWKQAGGKMCNAAFALR